MKAEKLLKRFLKEIGVYGSNESKKTLEFMGYYNDIIMPFNSFRWDTSDQGHDYWYFKAMEWVVYLYNNIENIDEEERQKKDLTKKKIKYELYDLIKYYCLRESKEEDLMKNESFKKAKELYDELNKADEIKWVKIPTSYYADGNYTVSYTIA